METIHITIDPAGRPTLKGEGFTGTKCNDRMKVIEDKLGAGKGATRTDHPETYAPEDTTSTEQPIHMW